MTQYRILTALSAVAMLALLPGCLGKKKPKATLVKQEETTITVHEDNTDNVPKKEDLVQEVIK